MFVTLDNLHLFKLHLFCYFPFLFLITFFTFLAWATLFRVFLWIIIFFLLTGSFCFFLFSLLSSSLVWSFPSLDTQGYLVIFFAYLLLWYPSFSSSNFLFVVIFQVVSRILSIIIWIIVIDWYYSTGHMLCCLFICKSALKCFNSKF